tara:strand:- start:1587 stop:2003 length:417 start_codon:yes stop_codon:yes gene_type:complete
MASNINNNTQHLLHALDHALTGELSEEECVSLVAGVGDPHCQFLASAACTWNRRASTTRAMERKWQQNYAKIADVRPTVLAAILNHTRFPQCRTGLVFGHNIDRLTDFAFPETNGMSIVECFVRSEQDEKQWLIRWLQ